MTDSTPLLSGTFTPSVADLLYKLHCTIVVSTYQAGKMIFISATDKNKINMLPRNFNHAMGISVDKNKIALACKDEVVILKNTPELAKSYPLKPNTYDALYLPRATYYTGQTDLHDISFSSNGIIAVNTLFSCIVSINEEYSFQNIWKPSFITETKPEDRCHLNGMITNKGIPLFVTALGESNLPQGWRENKLKGGVLIHVPSNQIIMKGLPMPHSPRVIENKIYLLLSAAGQLIEVEPQKGKFSMVHNFNCFVRGMDYIDDYLFVGYSKLRHNSSAFQDLPIAKNSTHAGIFVFHLPTAQIIGNIQFENIVEEIYDVRLIKGVTNAGIVNTNKDIHKQAITTPNGSYWTAEKK